MFGEATSTGPNTIIELLSTQGCLAWNVCLEIKKRKKKKGLPSKFLRDFQGLSKQQLNQLSERMSSADAFSGNSDGRLPCIPVQHQRDPKLGCFLLCCVLIQLVYEWNSSPALIPDSVNGFPENSWIPVTSIMQQIEAWLVILFLTRKKIHAKQIFVLSSSIIIIIITTTTTAAAAAAAAAVKRRLFICQLCAFRMFRHRLTSKLAAGWRQCIRYITGKDNNGT